MDRERETGSKEREKDIASKAMISPLSANTIPPSPLPTPFLPLPLSPTGTQFDDNPQLDYVTFRHFICTQK